MSLQCIFLPLIYQRIPLRYTVRKSKDLVTGKGGVGREQLVGEHTDDTRTNTKPRVLQQKAKFCGHGYGNKITFLQSHGASCRGGAVNQDCKIQLTFVEATRSMNVKNVSPLDVASPNTSNTCLP